MNVTTVKIIQRSLSRTNQSTQVSKQPLKNQQQSLEIISVATLSQTLLRSPRHNISDNLLTIIIDKH